MDLNAYHNAWMQGHKESECVRIAEDAYFKNQAQEAKMNAHYAELEREHYAELEMQHMQEMELQEKLSSDNVKDQPPAESGLAASACSVCWRL